MLLSEQGNFLALSNRPEVTAYLEKTYGNNIVQIDNFKITSNTSISAAYKVGEVSTGRPAAHLRKRMHRDDVGVQSVAA